METKLNNTSSIEQWRTAKSRADQGVDYRSQLGCVGEPIADLLDDILELLPEGAKDLVLPAANKAAAEARANLLVYVNEQRQAGAEGILETVVEVLGFSFDACDLEVQVTDTLEDIAERGYDHAVEIIENEHWSVSKLEIEDM